MTLPVKVGGGALTFATISGLSGVGSAYMSDKKVVNNTQQGTAISKIIEDKFDYILLSTKDDEDSSYWNANWGSYKRDNKDKDPKEDAFKLKGWIEGDKESLNLVDQLKKKCSELSDSIVYDGGKALYDNLTKYCARSITIKDQAEKEKLKLLSVEGTTGGGDWDAWTRKSGTRNSLLVDLETLGVVQKDNAYKIIERCKAVITIDKKDPNYSNIFKAYEKVCTR
ncbi:hypothetical protein A6V39_01330 [Candidatus Mycoplasma haematobovis]|uniref:Uncharacterized protein n=1 Tax=Candidatus Mycoplasma haematobovis TaxID=432608 RepID=A0A1A9QFH3_9MOLU|nr:hypothetical protein [Candidatus Mycoplasma haematobovis]OAL10696.1 hypothetical protein A6V39_01330 [Candidatus Mycoplasma haematobovis]